MKTYIWLLPNNVIGEGDSAVIVQGTSTGHARLKILDQATRRAKKDYKTLLWLNRTTPAMTLQEYVNSRVNAVRKSPWFRTRPKILCATRPVTVNLYL